MFLLSTTNSEQETNYGAGKVCKLKENGARSALKQRQRNLQPFPEGSFSLISKSLGHYKGEQKSIHSCTHARTRVSYDPAESLSSPLVQQRESERVERSLSRTSETYSGTGEKRILDQEREGCCNVAVPHFYEEDCTARMHQVMLALVPVEGGEREAEGTCQVRDSHFRDSRCAENADIDSI